MAHRGGSPAGRLLRLCSPSTSSRPPSLQGGACSQLRPGRPSPKSPLQSEGDHPIKTTWRLENGFVVLGTLMTRSVWPRFHFLHDWITHYCLHLCLSCVSKVWSRWLVFRFRYFRKVKWARGQLSWRPCRRRIRTPQQYFFLQRITGPPQLVLWVIRSQCALVVIYTCVWHHLLYCRVRPPWQEKKKNTTTLINLAKTYEHGV